MTWQVLLRSDNREHLLKSGSPEDCVYFYNECKIPGGTISLYKVLAHNFREYLCSKKAY